MEGGVRVEVGRGGGFGAGPPTPGGGVVGLEELLLQKGKLRFTGRESFHVLLLLALETVN